jgi:NADH-quinone oxidoreductase subunit N
MIFLCSVIFVLLLVSINDFFLVFYIVVAISLGLYGLILINLPVFANTPEAGAKYFLLSVTSVGLMFGGVKELYLFAGHLNFSIVRTIIVETILNSTLYEELFIIKFTVVFIAVGFFFKLAAAPNHFWAAEVYSSLPYELLLFFVVPVKLTFSLVFFKIMKSIFFIFHINDNLNFILYNEYEFILSFVIVSSMIIGSLNAIFEQNIRKFVAYSSVNQIGFLLIGFLGFKSIFFCFESFIFFVAIYFVNLFLFLFLLSEIAQTFYIPFGAIQELFNPHFTKVVIKESFTKYYLSV